MIFCKYYLVNKKEGRRKKEEGMANDLEDELFSYFICQITF
ncbi:MAG: hypothetical protein ACRC62_19755 [Microcoleus sp.]